VPPLLCRCEFPCSGLRSQAEGNAVVSPAGEGGGETVSTATGGEGGGAEGQGGGEGRATFTSPRPAPNQPRSKEAEDGGDPTGTTAVTTIARACKKWHHTQHMCPFLCSFCSGIRISKLKLKIHICKLYFANINHAIECNKPLLEKMQSYD
jgi:hypothetical protein